MKKFAIILTVLVLVAAIAYAAEIALSDYSYDQLVELHRKITAEIMSRPEWKEVEVPGGTWKIGEDIPAGSYSLSTPNNSSVITISGNNDYGIPSLIYMTEGETYGKIILSEGMEFTTTRSVIFAPVKGLGF